MAELIRRINVLRAEQTKLAKQVQAQAARVGLSDSAESRVQKLRNSGWATERNVERATDQRLEQDLRLGTIERTLADRRSQIEALEEELRSLPLKHQTELAELERSIAMLEQEVAENEARREIVITAPDNGTVTSIQAERGGSVNTSVPLLVIIPAGSELVAQLYSPSSAIGFVSGGQRVLIRYQAFPYQKFGHHEGEVTDISRSPISPGEMSQHLSAFTNLYGAKEPVYRITVQLTKQSIMAYGRQMPLQSGMQLEADVILERRRLYEWILDPLYTITGKMRQWTQRTT